MRTRHFTKINILLLTLISMLISSTNLLALDNNEFILVAKNMARVPKSNYVCMANAKRKKKFQLAEARKFRAKSTPKKITAGRINEIKTTILEAKRAGKKRRFKKLKKNFKRLRALRKSCKSGGFNPQTACSVASNLSPLGVIQNQKIDLTSLSNCKPKDLEFKVIKQPHLGRVSDDIYEAPYATGETEVDYKMCIYGICGLEVGRLAISVVAGDLVGDPDSLGKYRSDITLAEKRYLLQRMAYNIVSPLEDGGRELNLEGFVDKILSPDNFSADFETTLEKMRDGVYGKVAKYATQRSADVWKNPPPLFHLVEAFNTPSAKRNALDEMIRVYARTYYLNEGVYRYHSTEGRGANRFLLNARYGSPVHAKMFNFWAGHFGTAIKGFGSQWESYTYKYYDLLEKDALGNFKNLVIGDRPAINSLVSETPNGILRDIGSSRWLDNIYNTKYAPNENFARELLELYLLGVENPITGEQNYVEADIHAGTSFLSGYRASDLQSVTMGPGHMHSPSTRASRYWLEYVPSAHNTASKIAFEGTPWELSGSYKPWEYAEHIIDNHPGVPDFISSKMFRTLAHRDASPELLKELSDIFKNSGYNIMTLVRTIIQSEAFFSHKAYEPKCIKSPSDLFIEVARNFRLPLIEYNYLDDSIGQLVGIPKFNTAIKKSGEYILDYESVFTHDYCGRSEERFGQEWLHSSNLLGRTQGMTSFLNGVQDRGWRGFGLADLMPLIADFANVNLAEVTADNILDFFENRFNVELDMDEKLAIKELYLLNDMNSDGNLTSSDWDPEDSERMSAKIAGLLTIFSSQSISNVY